MLTLLKNLILKSQKYTNKTDEFLTCKIRDISDIIIEVPAGVDETTACTSYPNIRIFYIPFICDLIYCKKISSIQLFLVDMFFDCFSYKCKDITYISNAGFVTDSKQNSILFTTRIYKKNTNIICGVNIYINPLVFYRQDLFCKKFISQIFTNLLITKQENKDIICNIYIRDPQELFFALEPPDLVDMEDTLRTFLFENMEDITKILETT